MHWRKYTSNSAGDRSQQYHWINGNNLTASGEITSGNILWLMWMLHCRCAEYILGSQTQLLTQQPRTPKHDTIQKQTENHTNATQWPFWIPYCGQTLTKDCSLSSISDLPSSSPAKNQAHVVLHALWAKADQGPISKFWCTFLFFKSLHGVP